MQEFSILLFEHVLNFKLEFLGRKINGYLEFTFFGQFDYNGYFFRLDSGASLVLVGIGAIAASLSPVGQNPLPSSLV